MLDPAGGIALRRRADTPAELRRASWPPLPPWSRGRSGSWPCAPRWASASPASSARRPGWSRTPTRQQLIGHALGRGPCGGAGPSGAGGERRQLLCAQRGRGRGGGRAPLRVRGDPGHGLRRRDRGGRAGAGRAQPHRGGVGAHRRCRSRGRTRCPCPAAGAASTAAWSCIWPGRAWRGPGTRRTRAALCARAEAGDAAARAALDRHADRLARGLAAVLNILDPDVVVLGGGLSNMAHLYEQVPGCCGATCSATRRTRPSCGTGTGTAAGCAGRRGCGRRGADPSPSGMGPG